jgi:mono/diheme cytochrome c family protein
MRRLFAAAVLTLAVGCYNGVFRFKFGDHPIETPLYATLNPSLSDGDPVAGRRAFIELDCIDCHRVAEDPKLPKGPGAEYGPMLSGLHRYKAVKLADIIRNTNTGKNDEYLGRTMKDYTERMTVRQLVDVVAYLRNPRLPPS